MEREPRYIHNIPAVRRLRKQQTDAEELLWAQLRDRRFHGLKFRRQHAIQQYVVDFYCHEQRLVVELYGGIHRDRTIAENDALRQQYLQSLGLHFVRIPAEDVTPDVEHALKRIATAISPSPAKSGEGVGG